VFSPYYAWRGRREPDDHCAVNVALYGAERRWAMTERSRDRLVRSPNQLVIGPSSLVWDGRGLEVVFDERGAPWPRRVTGRIRLEPEALNAQAFELEAAGRHLWRPIAPLARVRAEFREPALSWSGHGYFDANRGDEPLEAAFSRWTWSRGRVGDKAIVFYDAERRRAPPLALNLAFDAEGQVAPPPAPPVVALPKSRWRLARTTRSAGTAIIVDRLEDTPFYARSRVRHDLGGVSIESAHESLDLDRFANPIVKAMLPFRMPRW